MKRSGVRHRRESGLGFYFIALISLFLMPVLLSMLKQGMAQNKNALKDRNIKTSREMAESVGIDYMNSISEDWLRDSFDEFYQNRSNPNFAGLGNASSSLTPYRSTGTIRLVTQATYDRGNTISQNARATKSVDAMYFFSSDAMKFDYVWNFPVTLGGNIDLNLTNLGDIKGTHYINGDFDAGNTPVILSGLWVVKGIFRIGNNVTLLNARVHCTDFVDTALRTEANFVGTKIRRYPLSNFVPHLFVIRPEGNGIVGDLRRYSETKISMSTEVSAGNSLKINFRDDDKYSFNLYDNLNNLIDWEVGDLIPFDIKFPKGQPEAPFILDIQGVGNVELSTCSISRPITVLVREGNLRVTGNIAYLWYPDARSDRSFGILCENNISFEDSGAGDQKLVGFYGTTKGEIHMTGNRNINLTGTLYGPIGIYALGAGFTLNVTADRQLARFPPPKYPRRPRLVMWDYMR